MKFVTKALGWFILLNLLVCVILNAAWQDLTYYQRDSDFSNLQTVLNVQEKMPWLPWVYFKPGSGHDGYWTWLGVSTDIQASNTIQHYQKTDNPFWVGDLVCVDPESGVKDTLPAVTIVLGVDGNLLRLVGHQGLVHHLHYGSCW